MRANQIYLDRAHRQSIVSRRTDNSVKNSWPYLILLLACASAWVQEPTAGPAANEALAKLMAGNQRYVRHKEQHPDQSLARRKEIEGSSIPSR